MTRVLGELLGANQPQFRGLISRLERAAGHPGVDIRITHEVAEKVREALRDMHLDMHDTTNEEFYAALQGRVKTDEHKILEGLSVHNTEDTELFLWSIQRFIQEQAKGHQVLAIKQSVIKKIFKVHPPKKAMRGLGYRSLDSMIKHESAASLLTAVEITESASWLKKFYRTYQELNTGDFEQRDIEVFQPRSARWKVLGMQASQQKRHTVLSFSEAGIVSILPIHRYIEGMAIANLVLALQACNGIFAVSTFLKLQQMTPRFSEEVARVASSNNTGSLWLGEQEVSWQTVHAYLAQQPEVHYFDPYIQSEDIFVLPIEKTLEKLYPAMSFWAGVGHGLRRDTSGVISCNVLDVAVNYCNKLGYAQASIFHGQQALWQELASRYIYPGAIEQQLLPALQPVAQETEVINEL
jgi:hypothetical protein